MSDQNPSANVTKQGPAEPLGDRGHGDKTWTPEPGEQGISNRVGDEDEPGPETDSTSFGQDSKDVVSMAEEDPDDEEFDEEDDDELEGEDEDADDDGAKS